MFLTIGGHTLLVGAVVRSFDVVPINGWPNFDDLTAGVVHASGGLLAVGLALAAPIVVTLLVTDVAVGFLARIAPQMNIFGIELPAKVLADLRAPDRDRALPRGGHRRPVRHRASTSPCA